MSEVLDTYKAVVDSNSSLELGEIIGYSVLDSLKRTESVAVSDEKLSSLNEELNVYLEVISKKQGSSLSKVGFDGKEFSLKNDFVSNEFPTVRLLKKMYNTGRQGFSVEKEKYFSDDISKALSVLGAVEEREYSGREIKDLYRKKIMVVHPDRGGNVEEAKLVNVAYDTLGKGNKSAFLSYSRRISDSVFDEIRSVESERVAWIEALINYSNNLLRIEEDTLKLFGKASPERFVGGGFKKSTGRKIRLERLRRAPRRAKNLWHILAFLKNRFESNYFHDCSDIKESVGKSDFKKALEKIGKLMKVFDLKTPTGLGRFNFAGFNIDNLNEPKSIEDFFLSLYFIIDGGSFSARVLKSPRNSGSVLWILEALKEKLGSKISNKTDLEVLTELLVSRVKTKMEFGVLREKAIFQSNDWLDNWLDLFHDKLVSGFSPEEVESFNNRILKLRSRAVKKDKGFVRLKSFEDAVLGIQFFFEQMHDQLISRKQRLPQVKQEWEEVKNEINKLITSGRDVLHNFNAGGEGLTGFAKWGELRENLWRDYASKSVFELIAREIHLSLLLSRLINYFTNNLIGKEGIFSRYFQREGAESLIDKQVKLLQLTQLENDKIYIETVKQMVDIINNIQENFTKNKQTIKLLKQ